MKLELRNINETNIHAVELLEVTENQKQYIASNKKSLAAARSEEHRAVARPFGIYADNRLVGFTMFAFDLGSDDPDDRYWLWRFMIDRNFQGNGYGSAALETIIEYFRSHSATHILLSTKPANTAALSLYHRYQFAETGEWNDGEIILRRKL